jgi:hypothetical protein
MLLLRTSLLAVLALLTLQACQNQALKDMEAVKDKICACKDQACVRALDAEFKAQEAKMSELEGADQEKAIEISLATLQCATALAE